MVVQEAVCRLTKQKALFHSFLCSFCCYTHLQAMWACLNAFPFWHLQNLTRVIGLQRLLHSQMFLLTWKGYNTSTCSWILLASHQECFVSVESAFIERRMARLLRTEAKLGMEAPCLQPTACVQFSASCLDGTLLCKLGSLQGSHVVHHTCRYTKMKLT